MFDYRRGSMFDVSEKMEFCSELLANSKIEKIVMNTSVWLFLENLVFQTIP